MEIFKMIVEYLKAVPDWVPLLLLPALTLCSAILFTLFGARKTYAPLTVVLVFCGFLFMMGEGLEFALVYLALYSAIAALLSMLFYIPKLNLNREAKQRAMYEKFHEALTEKPFGADKKPAKVCCFEGADQETSESGVSFSYADGLVKKLRTEKLTAGDRLELEELARILERSRNKPLTGEEQRTLNDALSGVLRLTAKYKL